MPKSNRGGLSGRRSGTVTVIEEPVRRSSRRTAKIAFYALWPIIALLTATVLASKWHPIIALAAGIGIGLAVASVTAAVIAAWPLIRTLWWWTPEIILAFGLVTGWVYLADHTTLYYRLTVVILIIGVPAVIPPVRGWIVATFWCLVTRHRIRVCFSEFIITNRTGSLPLIMWARPTPIGERIWIWLRPGLALDDIQSRLDLIAVACWADTAFAQAASESNSAFVRLDIKRRDALTAPIISPLLGLLNLGTPAQDHDDLPAPTALDLPDVSATDVTPAKPVNLTRADKKTSASTPAPAPSSGIDPDVADYL